MIHNNTESGGRHRCKFVPALMIEPGGEETKVWKCTVCGIFYSVSHDIREVMAWSASFKRKGEEDE